MWVCDTGFASEENRADPQRAGGHYILGEKLRQGTENRAALARQGRYPRSRRAWSSRCGSARARRAGASSSVATSTRRAATACAASGRSSASPKSSKPSSAGTARRASRRRPSLLTHPTLRRYLTRRRGRLVIDRRQAQAERHLDGKFHISSSDDSLTPAEMALYYKQLKEVERGWRDQKHILDLRPIYHRKEERIRAHVLLSFLALLLTRVAETRAHDTGATCAASSGSRAARARAGRLPGPERR